MSTTVLKTWIREQLETIDPRAGEASADYADVVRELKIRTLEIDPKLSLSLPILDKKYAASAVGQLRRVLEELETPAAVPNDGLFNLEQAAAYLGYKPEGLRKIVKQKQIQYSQNGRGPIRFRRKWLDEFTEKNAGGPKDIERSPAKRQPAPLPLPPAAFGFNPSLIRG